MDRYEAVVIGCSAGGLEVLLRLLEPLPQNFPLPVIIASHITVDGGGLLVQVLRAHCAMAVEEPVDKQPVLPGSIYVAPANYHLLVESDRSFALSVDQRVCCVRPSIDVLFSAAADAWGERLVAALLTGVDCKITVAQLSGVYKLVAVQYRELEERGDLPKLRVTKSSRKNDPFTNRTT